MIRKEKVKDTFSDLITSSVDELSMDLSEPTVCYIVNLVSDFVDKPQVSIKGVNITGLIYEGLNCPTSMRSEFFKAAGDSALFIAGMFPDSFESGSAKTRSLGSYIDLGQVAYNNLEWDLFSELSIRFPELVDVLNTVSVKARLTSISLEKYIKRRMYIDARTSRR